VLGIGPKSNGAGRNDRPNTVDNNERQKAMKPRDSQSGFCKPVIGSVTAVLCAIVILTLGPSPGSGAASGVASDDNHNSTGNEAPKFRVLSWIRFVAPMALYSDETPGSNAAASTYPLEIIQLQQWMERNKI